ncbi:fungal-specific transcription factor domain-containing protein [Xylariaceae sp. FL0255]|nr:fungal-specific transcription factor domain-containing protein [Xylariaceae sp. FL0255]
METPESAGASPNAVHPTRDGAGSAGPYAAAPYEATTSSTTTTTTTTSSTLPHNTSTRPLSQSYITGPITLDPFAPVSDILNPRSCVTCRRRKVRCDKHMPCGNCRKAQIQCVFPAPGRAPRRPRAKDPNAPPKQTSEREMELMKRLRKLEGIVEDLSGQIEFESYKHNSDSQSPEATSDHTPDRRQTTHHSASTESTPAYSPGGHPVPRRSNTGSTIKGQVSEVNKDFGKLVVNEKGNARYVSNKFLSKITDEIEALRSESQRLTDESDESSEDEGSPLPPVHPQPDQHFDHHGFIFGYSSSEVDLRKLHPLPSQQQFYWQIFRENVDPLVKILHVPTMNKLISELRTNMNSITPGHEALMFTVYFAAIISMEAEDVLTNFGAEKTELVARYRFASEQALAKAGFLNTSELVVVQALMLFIVVVRRYDYTRFAWTLNGLLIRIGQSLGLHRDGTHFPGLTPFEIEMRRRIWWGIAVLDLRSAEDQGSELTVAEQMYDTQFPLNVNDDDIYAEMTELPPERIGTTDMSFCLIRSEICSLSRKLHSAANPMASCQRDQEFSVEEHEEKIIEMYRHIDRKYLKPSADKESDLISWVSSTVTRLIMSKMTLVIYQPLMKTPGEELAHDVRDRLLLATINVIEYGRVLHAEEKILHWRWLFQTYTQWHAVAYLLLEIVRRPWSPTVERGWTVLDAMFHSSQIRDIARPSTWGPIRKLMIHATRYRQKEIARLRNDPQAALALDAEEQARVEPASFRHLASSLRSTLARDHWYNLMGLKPPGKPPHNVGLFFPHLAQQQKDTAAQAQQESPLKAEMTTNAQVPSIEADQQYFDPQDAISMALSGDSTAFARLAILGDDMLGQIGGFKSDGVPVETFNTRGSQAFPLGGPPSATTMSSSIDNNPNFAAMRTDDHPPPWLWNPGVSAGQNALSSGMYSAFPTSMGGMMGGEEEIDVNMDADEIVNWQNWMDPGVGLNRIGFTGGI